jgi:hypothetical protein
MDTLFDIRLTNSVKCDCSVLELPLDLPDTSLFVFLPNRDSGFPEMELDLIKKGINDVIEETMNSLPTTVNVKFPR